jgi:hypothetical protein
VVDASEINDTGRAWLDVADKGIVLLAADMGGNAADPSEGDARDPVVEMDAGRFLAPAFVMVDGVRMPDMD